MYMANEEGFGDLTIMAKKNNNFCNVTPFSLEEVYREFG
jgi:hypothetical protein